MSKRSIQDVDDVEIDSRPEKKRKIQDSEEIWKKMKNMFDENTKKVGDHVLWIGPSTKHSIFPFKNYFGLKARVYLWYRRFLDKNPVVKEDFLLEKTCDEKMCISHYLYRDTSIKSIRELDPDTYTLIGLHLDRCSKVSDLPTGNAELKTKCRIWTGELDKNGYGKVRLFGNQPHASAVALQLKLCDDLDEGIQARHKCRNRHCINEDHLEPGTNDDNVADKERDGTMYRGEDHPCSKMTNELVKKIFWSKLENKSRQERSDEFGVSKSVITSIDTGANWSHLFSDEDRAKMPKIKPRNASKIPKEKDLMIIEDYKLRGISVLQCSRELNLSKKSITRIYKGTFEIKSTSYEEMTEKQKLKKLAQMKGSCDILEEDEKTHWLWKLYKNADGYGQTRLKGHTIYAHRISFMMVNDCTKINPEMIRHKCLFKNCINPDHLEEGNGDDNAQDKIRDGTLLFGDSHPSSTITSEIAKAIKESKGQGTKLDRSIKFDVSVHIVNSIDNGYAWTRV